MATSERTGARTEPGSRVRRIARTSAWIVVGASGTLLFLVVAALGLARTEAGGRLLARWSTAAVNDAIVGHVSVGHLAFRGTSLELRDVVLRDPEGRTVASLAQLFVSYHLLPLLHHEVHVGSLLLGHPTLLLEKNADGLNLSRALAPRHPSPAEPKKKSEPGTPWRLTLDRFALASGTIEATLARPQTSPLRLAVRELAIDVAGHLVTDLREADVTGALAASVEGLPPRTRSLAFNVRLLRHANDGNALDVATAGNATLRFGELVALDARLTASDTGTVELGTLHLPPELMRALSPTWPLTVSVDAKAKVALEKGTVEASARISGEGTSGALTFTGDLAAGGATTPHGLTLEAHDLRLSQWMAGMSPLPPLLLRARVEPGRVAPDALTGSVRLDMAQAQLRGHRYGPLHLAVDVERGELGRLAAFLKLPGLVVTGEGGTEEHPAEGRATTVTLRVAADELSTLRSALLSWMPAPTSTSPNAAPALPPLAGKAALSVALIGTRTERWASASWRAKASLQSAFIRVGTTRFEHLDVEAEAPRLESARQELALTAALAAPVDARLALQLTASEERPAPNDDRAELSTTAVSLQSFALDYGTTHWRSATVAHLRMTGDDLALRDLLLRAGEQSIAAEATRAHDRWDGHAKIEALDLARLPWPRTVRGPIDGALDAEARWTGPSSSPAVDAMVALKDARYGAFAHVGADLRATLRDAVPAGTLSIDAAGRGRAKLTFHGPALGGDLTRSPAEITLDVTDVRLARLPLPADAPARLAGSVDAHLALAGTVEAPRLSLTVNGQRLAVRPVKVSRSDVEDAGTDAFRYPTLTARLDYVAPALTIKLDARDDEGGRLRVEGATKIAARELLEATPAHKRALARRAVRGQVALQRWDTAGIALFVPSLRKLEGRLTAAMNLRGNLHAPRLEGELAWKDGGFVAAAQGGTPPRDRREDGTTEKAAPETTGHEQPPTDEEPPR